MMRDLVIKSRSIRRFYGDKEIKMEQLRELVDCARLTPSGANKQPLKYQLVCSKEMNEKVYQTLLWAGYLKDWDGPIPSERPTGYIIMLRDKSLTNVMTIDEGICAQTIFLGATDMGLGGCILSSIRKEQLSEILELSDDYEIALVIALGYPKEEVVITEIKDEDFKYYRDENQVHYVPKRSLDEIIIKEN